MDETRGFDDMFDDDTLRVAQRNTRQATGPQARGLPASITSTARRLKNDIGVAEGDSDSTSHLRVNFGALMPPGERRPPRGMNPGKVELPNLTVSGFSLAEQYPGGTRVYEDSEYGGYSVGDMSLGGASSEFMSSSGSMAAEQSCARAREGYSVPMSAVRRDFGALSDASVTNHANARYLGSPNMPGAAYGAESFAVGPQRKNGMVPSVHAWIASLASQPAHVQHKALAKAKMTDVDIYRLMAQMANQKQAMTNSDAARLSVMSAVARNAPPGRISPKEEHHILAAIAGAFSRPAQPRAAPRVQRACDGAYSERVYNAGSSAGSFSGPSGRPMAPEVDWERYMSYA